MTSTLASAMGITWTQTPGLPIGLGANVKGQLVPARLVKPLFDWVRVDVQFLADKTAAGLRKARDWYAGMGAFVVWMVNTPLDIDALYAAGIRNACIEGPDEPNLSFPGRPAFTPTAYAALLSKLWTKCRQYSYTLIGIGASHWQLAQAWIVGVTSRKATDSLTAVGQHGYGCLSDYELSLLLGDLDIAFAKPKVITEFSIRPGDLYSRERYGVPDTETRSLQSVVLASIIREAMRRMVAFAVYDLAASEPETALLDDLDLSKAQPTQLYKDTFSCLLPDQYPQWIAAQAAA